MLMMLACGVLLAKIWAADAHDAGLGACFWGKIRTADAHDAGLLRASEEKIGELMLMMLAGGVHLENTWGAAAHDAGLRCDSGKTAGQLMLMMLACGVLLGNKLCS